MVVAQARTESKTGITVLSDKDVKEYSSYKPYLLFYALVELIITLLFKVFLKYVANIRKIINSFQYL